MRPPARPGGGVAWQSARSTKPGRSRPAPAAGVKRQYLGCAGKVANGINTVHLAYVREGTGHALIGAREWIPAAQIGDPATSAVMGLPQDLVFRTKASWLSTSSPRPSPTACGWTSYAVSTARAPSCATTWKTTTRPTCCGSPPASGSPWPAGLRSPASRPPGGWAAGAAGRSARPGRDRRDSAGTPGRGHGRPGHLRRHRRPAPAPHRPSGTRPGATTPAPAGRVRDDPAHRPGNRAPAQPPTPARQRRALAGLAPIPPGPVTLVPPANTARPRSRNCPGQIVNGRCRTRLPLPKPRRAPPQLKQKPHIRAGCGLVVSIS